MSNWFPLTLAVVAVAGSVYGIWLGNQLQTRREDRRWRLDRRLDAYIKYLATIEEWQIEQATPRPSTKEEFERLGDRTVEHSHARATVYMLGSAPVAAAAKVIETQTDNYLDARAIASDKGEKHSVYPELSVDDFLRAARKELGFEQQL